ncbi:hypothetical protein ACWEO4_42630 [Streptomyces sp. NPDC004393]|uniref:hypothetical protein n=1 Tax=unclassified Streptomyces TaxID=2593676 RepID=UPI0007C77CA3|nr:hypothetical protein [Streptomyces sp. TP-A0356]
MTAHGSATSTRWAHLAERLPASLEELSGPDSGSVELPLHLAWSGLTRFDLDDEQLLVGLYRIVLTNGLREDLTRYLNADLLLRHWPRLRIALGRPVRTCWEQRFPQLVTAAAA